MPSKLMHTDNLSQIYPNISQQLCNRHIKRISELRNTFSDVYDQLEPDRYIIVNGAAKIIDLGRDIQLNFGLQNGIIVLCRRTYKNQELFINGNHLEQELIFNSKGKHTDGIHQLIDQIKLIIKTIRKQAQPSHEFYGGILYIHSNIGQKLFAYRECFILGVILAMLSIQQMLEDYSKEQILELAVQVDSQLSAKILTNLLFDYELGKCVVDFGSKPIMAEQNQSDFDLDLTLCNPNSDKSIGTHQSNQSIKSQKLEHKISASTNSNNSISSLEEHANINAELNSVGLKIGIADNNRLIFCKLDLSKEQEDTFNAKMERIRTITELMQQQKLSKIDIFDENEALLNSSPLKQLVSADQIGLIKYCEQNRLLLSKLTNGQLSFSDFLRQKHFLDVDYQIFDQQIFDLIGIIQQEVKFLQNFCIIEGSVLLICMNNQHYAEVMCFLRKLLNDYKLSTHRFLSTNKKIANQSNYEIGEIMFSSAPSVGCAIYTPTQDVWI